MRRITPRHLLYFAIPLVTFFSVTAVMALYRSTPEVAATQTATPPGSTPEPHLDDGLGDDMLNALNPEPVTIPEALYNPFTDRIGAGHDGASGLLPANYGAGITQASFPRGMKLPGAPGAQSQGAPPKPFEERFTEWQQKGRAQRAKHEPVTPRTSIYSLTEMKLIGTTTNGGAWLFFKPEGRAFTALPGTRLLDAILKEVTGAGAVFQPTTEEGKPVGSTLTIPFSRDSK